MNLLWAHALLVWAVTSYGWRDPFGDEPPAGRAWRVRVIGRSIAAAGLIWTLSSSVWLALLMLSLGALLPFVRALTPARYSAEVEVVANVAFTASSLLLITKSNLDLGFAPFRLPLSNDRIATCCVVVALLLFTIHGGTYIVRSLLKKSGAVPMIVPADGTERAIDVKEYNRGRLIGSLERVLLLAVVIAGSYEALGFIVAAKGLVRSREFEVSRDMTEYFLIGSLASVLVALATGSLARHVIATYW